MTGIFNKAYDLVCHNEGGYVNDPDDTGGETYKGVARRYNEDWKGWQIIDRYKEMCDIPPSDSHAYRKRIDSLLRGNNEIDAEIRDLYYQRYWKPCKCDEIAKINPKLAVCVFDYAINSGVSRACKDLQACTGSIVDGKIGHNTLSAIELVNKDGKLVDEYLARRRSLINSSKKIATKFKKGLNNRLDHLASVEI